MHRTTDRNTADPRYNAIRWIFYSSMAALLVVVILVDHLGGSAPLPAVAAGREFRTEASLILPAAAQQPTQTVNTPEITLDEYSRIESGMTQTQVMEIVGGDGDLLVENGKGPERMMMRIYHGSDTSRATVTFLGGAVTKKAELGLR